MKASEGTLLRFLDGGDKKFIVPIYQRQYSWKLSNCEQLFKDLRSVYENNYGSHFIGSIVYVAEDVGGLIEHIIIDGQQRIITVSLLLLAFRNYIRNKGISSTEINVEKINDYYLTDKYAHSQKKLKLKLVEGDDIAYNHLIENTSPIENSIITLNYNYFYDQLKHMTISEIEKLYNAITKLMIVKISLKPQDGDDPQLIFESLNSTGLALEESDKIRNYVLMGLISNEQERIYTQYWQILDKTIGKKYMTKFIRYYLAIKFRYLPSEDKLYVEFKKYRNCQSCSIDDVLNDMLNYAKYFEIIINCKSFQPGYNGCIGRLISLDVNTSIPLLFDLLDAKALGLVTDEGLNECAKLVESYYVRRMVCGLSLASLNRTFVSIGLEATKAMQDDSVLYIDAFKYSILCRSGKSRFPNEHDFRENFAKYELYNAKPSFRKYVLERLENYNTLERIAVEEQIDSGDLTIEHIMPQAITEEWKESIGDSWELIHTKYLHTIGNLTLTAYNSDYSNLSFMKKKEMPHKGFDFSKLSLNQYVKNCNGWGEKEINERAKLLCDIALHIWPIPITTFEPKIAEEWVDLDEEYDFTDKLISKISFKGDEISTKDITDAYLKINVLLFNFDSEIYSSFESQYISSDKATLKKPFKISNAMFAETKMNSQYKINLIRKLFKHFEIENSDLLFLVGEKRKSDAFDITDESTYNNIKVGQLAFQLMRKLLLEHKIPADEIKLLTEKEYSAENFKKATYPILAYSRDANQGASKQYRYYSESVIVDSVRYFITSQWYDESRNDLIKWYNKHYQ